MSSFNMVPLVDVQYLLNLYNIPYENNIYLQCWNFIINNKNILIPVAIADFIIAYNNLHRKNTISYKHSYQIIFASKYELESLQFGTTNKERIIRILSYMNVLNDSDITLFDTIPTEILRKIMLNLTCSDILLLCDASKNLNKFCSENLSVILREILEKKLHLNMINYDINVLKSLCRIKNNNKLSGGFKKYLTLNYDGTINDLNVKDIISISGGDNNFLLLDCNGKVLNHKLEYENISNVIEISAGYDHYMFLKSNGNVYVKGNNTFGQLGIKVNDVKNVVRNLSLNNIVQISTYSNHSLALRSDGKVYSFGNNKYNQLGYKTDKTNEYSPKIIPGLDDVVQISAGNGFSLVLRSNGKVYGFGNNKYGQLKLDDDIINFPTQIPKLNNIIKISAGNRHFLALDKNGKVYSSKNIELNDIDDIYAGNDYSLFLDKNGNIIFRED